MHPYSLPIRQAVAIIQRGGLIAYPTEGVFGLGCNPFDGAAVARLLALKQRPLHKGLILISDRVERFEPFLAPLTDAHWQRMCSRWPGPMTWPRVSTSANRQGRPALERQLQVRQQLANELDFIVPGRVLTPGKASQIEDLISGQRYRA
jgi:L-threonylcarbamoyladenylate synthase